MTPLSIVSAAVGLTFVLLAAVHVYWAGGGGWLKGSVVPELRGKAAFEPSRAAILGVAAALAVCATIVATAGNLIAVPISLHSLSWIVFALSALFFVRAVGDFRLVGFFKRVTGTRFARLDAALYSPLCALLAAGLFTIGLLRMT